MFALGGGTLIGGLTIYCSSFGVVEQEHEFRGDNGLVYKLFPSIPRGRVLVCMNSVQVVVCHSLWDVVECVDEKCLSNGRVPYWWLFVSQVLSANVMNEMSS